MKLARKVVLINPSVLVTHSRIQDTAKPGEKFSFSEVWTKIAAGAKAGAKEKSVDLTILSPRNYYDPDEFLGLVERGAAKKPDSLILPFTPVESAREGRFLDILGQFEGKIVAVNVPPNKTAIDCLGNRLTGYVGMSEFRAGEIAAEQLLSGAKYTPDRIVILTHEKDHYAHSLRIEGVRKVADRNQAYVEEIYVGTDAKEVALPKDLDKRYFGIITLGNRGSEAALTIDSDRLVGIVGIDLNTQVTNAILESRMNCTLIQHPFHQGKLAVDMALEPLRKTTEVPCFWCGPTLVDPYNVRVFNSM